MITVYFVHHEHRHQEGTDPYSMDLDYQKEIDEIKKLNPDKIIVFCGDEYQPEIIFKVFFDRISDWLVIKNKTITVLGVGPEGLRIKPNIIMEKTCSYYLNNYNIMMTHLDSDIDFINIHEEARHWFTCYSSNPKFERALLLDQLVANNLLQHGIVTFNNPGNVQYDRVRGQFKWQHHDGSRLFDETDFSLHSKPEFSPYMFPKSFFKGFFDLVLESAYDPGIFLLTEKTTKSLVALKPFIVLSSINYHKELVDTYGMELYDELFDYSFDNKPNIDDRIQGIIDNLNRIVQMDIGKIKELHDTLLPKMIANRQRFLDYTLIKENIVPKSLMFLTETSDYKLYGNIETNQLMWWMGDRGWLLK